MFKSKGFLKILLVAGIASSVLVGCVAKTEVEPLRLGTPEELVDTFIKDNQEDNVSELAKLYADVYVDSTGYDLATIEKILEKSRKETKIISSELVSMEDYSDTIKRATIKITSKANDEETTNNYDYALIKEEEGWAISPDGIIACENYDIPMYNKGELTLNLAKNIKLFEGGILRVKVYNDSKNQFMFGSENNKCEIIVETSTGKYVTTMDEPTKLDKKVNSYFLARITELDGEINKVTVTNVYDLDKDGNVIEDSKKDVVAYQK